MTTLPAADPPADPSWLPILMERFDRIDQRLDRNDQRFNLIDQRFDLIDQRLDLIDQRFDLIDQRFDRIDGQFHVLHRKVEASCYNTHVRLSNASIKGSVGYFMLRCEQEGANLNNFPDTFPVNELELLQLQHEHFDLLSDFYGVGFGGNGDIITARRDLFAKYIGIHRAVTNIVL